MSIATKILCVECHKGKLRQIENSNDLFCKACGTQFEYTNDNHKSFKYKKAKEK